METDERLEFALTFIDALMPDPIVVPGAVRAASRRQHLTKAKGRQAGPALKQRDKEIRAHFKGGKGAQWIAAEYGLHVSVIYEVIHGTKEAA